MKTAGSISLWEIPVTICFIWRAVYSCLFSGSAAREEITITPGTALGEQSPVKEGALSLRLKGRSRVSPADLDGGLGGVHRACEAGVLGDVGQRHHAVVVRDEDHIYRRQIY